MTVNELSVNQILNGPDAFYQQQDYEEKTREDFSEDKALKQPIYRFETENKVWRVVKDILSVIIFPIGLYRLIHSLAGYAIIPATIPRLCFPVPQTLSYQRKHLPLKDQWKFKRISVEVDGRTIDAVIMGKASTLGNGRWLLASNGNSECYEDKLDNSRFKQIISELNGNALIFNYPGVGCSSGMPNRSAMAKAYRAMLNFLEDQEKGVGATEIVGYGYSIGGGVQGDALLSHKLKDDVAYTFVKDRTFSDLSSAASGMMKFNLLGRIYAILVKIFGWNISSIESSKKLQAPEIIMQTAVAKGKVIPSDTNMAKYEDISDEANRILDDGVITAEASLAKRLLDDKECPRENKFFMGIPEYHNDGVCDPQKLALKIEEMLSK